MVYWFKMVCVRARVRACAYCMHTCALYILSLYCVFHREWLVPTATSTTTTTTTTTTDDTAFDLTRAKLIGQERDGGVLFCWDKEEEGKGVRTFVGWHLLNTKTFLTLYRCVLDVHCETCM